MGFRFRQQDQSDLNQYTKGVNSTERDLNTEKKKEKKKKKKEEQFRLDVTKNKSLHYSLCHEQTEQRSPQK